MQKTLPNDWLAEILFARNYKQKHGQDHDSVAVVVPIDQIVVMLVSVHAKLVDY
jgi:hypothetical protein